MKKYSKGFIKRHKAFLQRQKARKKRKADIKFIFQWILLLITTYVLMFISIMNATTLR